MGESAKDSAHIFDVSSAVIGTMFITDPGRLLYFPDSHKIELEVLYSGKHAMIIPISLENVTRAIYGAEENIGQELFAVEIRLSPGGYQKINFQIEPYGHSISISKREDERKFQVFFPNFSTTDIAFIKNIFKKSELLSPATVVELKSKEEDDDDDVVIVSTEELKKESRKKRTSVSEKEKDTKDSIFEPPLTKKSRKKHPDVNQEEIDWNRRPRRAVRKDYSEGKALELTEEKQIEEALKRSMKNIDPSMITDDINDESTTCKKKSIRPCPYEHIDKSIELFSFPATRGNVIVRMEDYICLSRNEYLSDVIIDFYLNYIYDTKLTAEQKEKTYIVGSHFYTLYSTSAEFSGWNNEENSGLSAIEKRYNRVNGIIDENVNIFEKDFLIFPLMDNNHWFLAIVCFPKLNGAFTINGNVEVTGDDARRNVRKQNEKDFFQEPLKTSCVLIFDSVKGNSARRTVAMKHIKNFLESEWEAKYRNEFLFQKADLIGHAVTCPLQANNVDCGCFVLEFMERFFVTSRIEDFRLPLSLSNWFDSDIVRREKRRQIASVIQVMMESSQIELPDISFVGDSQVVTVLSDDMNNSANNGNNNNNNNNNNNEEFNNNNDFNCLDSNPTQVIINSTMIEANPIEEPQEDNDPHAILSRNITELNEKFMDASKESNVNSPEIASNFGSCTQESFDDDEEMKCNDDENDKTETESKDDAQQHLIRRENTIEIIYPTMIEDKNESNASASKTMIASDNNLNETKGYDIRENTEEDEDMKTEEEPEYETSIVLSD